MSKRFFTLIMLFGLTTMCRAINDDLLNNNSSSSISTARGSIFKNGLTRSVGHIFAQCTENEDILWCFKVQATKLLGRALKVHNINVINGFTIIKRIDSNDTQMESEGRSNNNGEREINMSNHDIESLSMKSLNALLLDRFSYFMQSRQIQIKLPRMLAFAEKNGQKLLQDIVNYVLSYIENGDESEMNEMSEEGRGKKKDKKYLGMFIAAVMLKTAILKMAYHSIAIIAGKALIVGKIALIISAIIGLKKLVGGEGGEKTTYEIVKHPQVQQSHTYSSSHAGEYEGGHESGSGGSYHRSIDDEMMMQDKAYHAWVPTTKIT